MAKKSKRMWGIWKWWVAFLIVVFVVLGWIYKEELSWFLVESRSDKFKLAEGVEGGISYDAQVSDNGRIVAWRREGTDGKQWIVVNGKEGKKYDAAYGLYVSPDGKRVAYYASDSSGFFVVVNGREIRNKEGQIVRFAFSPDGKRFAY